jgi:hypothetical protein
MHGLRTRIAGVLFTGLLMSTGLVSGAASAGAGPGLPAPPEGNWTRVGDDAFEHFACRHRYSGLRAVVSTATYRTDPDAPPDIGVYGAVIKGRGEDAKVIDSVTSVDWTDRWLYTDELIGSATRRQALWVQGAYYGPPAYDGELRIPISQLVHCAKPA